MASYDEGPPKGSAAIAARQREHLDNQYLDDVLEDEGDELSRRIVAAARLKGLDPTEYGVLVPTGPKKDLAKRTQSYLEKNEIMELVENQSEKLEIIHRRHGTLRKCAGFGVFASALMLAVGAPGYALAFASVSIISSILLQRSFGYE